MGIQNQCWDDLKWASAIHPQVQLDSVSKSLSAEKAKVEFDLLRVSEEAKGLREEVEKMRSLVQETQSRGGEVRPIERNCRIIYEIDHPLVCHQVIELRTRVASLQEEADRSRAAASAASSRQRTLEESLSMLEAEAAERSRKFALVQRSFRTTESELREQVEALTEEARAARQMAMKAELKV